MLLRCTMSNLTFPTKNAARQHVWQTLQDEKAAAFPFPPTGRIPNFAGAAEAARRLMDHPWFKAVRRIKCNPDAPQRPLRELALRVGIELLIPTPRLSGGFRLLDPGKIPEAHYRKAVTLSGADRWGRKIPVFDLPRVDLIVTGSVAVTRQGKRCGKGHGYGDLEYAILRELNHPAVRVVTTTHPLQLVDDFPVDGHDLPLHLIITPEETIEVSNPPVAPAGVDWGRLSDSDLDAMPVLRELRETRGGRA